MAKAKKPATIGRNTQVVYGVKDNRSGVVVVNFWTRDVARAARNTLAPKHRKDFSVVRCELVVKGRA